MQPEPALPSATFRRALTPVFVFKRYPRNYWLVLDAMCEIAGYFRTATLGLESLARRTGLHRRTVQKIRESLEAEGVIQLIEQSEGGKFSESERHGSPGRANVYGIGPAAWNLPLKLTPRTYAKPRRYEPRIPTQNRAGTRATVPTQNRAATHALSSDVRVFRHVELKKKEGMGEEEGTRRPESPQPLASCHYCQAVGMHHDWCQALNSGWVTR